MKNTVLSIVNKVKLQEYDMFSIQKSLYGLVYHIYGSCLLKFILYPMKSMHVTF